MYTIHFQPNWVRRQVDICESHFTEEKVLIDHVVGSDLQSLEQQLDKSVFRSKRVLVAGGAGFIGSWLCDMLVSANALVHCIDNLSTGLSENIDHLSSLKNFKFTQLDVTQFDLNEDCDLVFHLASRASPSEYQQYPVQTLLANSIGTRNMLELVRKNDATLLYASSSEVYGDAQVVPTPETYWGVVNPIGVRSCYDEGKRFGEALCMAYQRSHGLDIRIARIFNTFGPRIRADGAYGRVVSRFIQQALARHDITVYGNGGQTRSLCYITDTLSGLSKMASTDSARGEIFNIGNPHEISISDLAQRILELTGSDSKIAYEHLPPDDPVRRCPDISKAKHVLGWEPEASLDDALKKTIEWFRFRLG